MSGRRRHGRRSCHSQPGAVGRCVQPGASPRSRANSSRASARSCSAASGLAGSSNSAAARRSSASPTTISTMSPSESSRRWTSARPTPTADDSIAPARCAPLAGMADALSIAPSAERYKAAAARSRCFSALMIADLSAARTEGTAGSVIGQVNQLMTGTHLAIGCSGGPRCERGQR